MVKKSALIEALKLSGLAQGLSAKNIDELIRSSRVKQRTLERGEIVFHEGDTPRGLYILLSGEVRILKDTFSGRRIFISEIADPGDLFAEVYMAMHRPYDIYCIATVKTEIIEIETAYFLSRDENTETAFHVQRNLMGIFARKAFNMHNHIKILASGTIRERIVRYLLRGMAPDHTVTLTVTREYMASFIAVTRPSLSRELSAMQRDGLIRVEGRHITITDLDALEEYL